MPNQLNTSFTPLSNFWSKKYMSRPEFFKNSGPREFIIEENLWVGRVGRGQRIQDWVGFKIRKKIRVGFRQGRIEHPRPQIYLGLVVGIWACLGLDFATFSIFYSILSLFMGKICLFWTFYNRNLGWQNGSIRLWQAGLVNLINGLVCMIK